MLKRIFNFAHFLFEKQQKFLSFILSVFSVDLEAKLSLQINQINSNWHLHLYWSFSALRNKHEDIS